MKTVQWLAALSLIFILSACGAADTTKEDISSQMKFLTASQKADELVIDHIQKAKEEKITFQDLEARLTRERDFQQNLFNSISSMNASEDGKKAREGSLSYISEKITSYNSLIQTLSMENYDLLQNIVETHKISEEQYGKKAIEEINMSLTSIGENEIDSFEVKEEMKSEK